jgi:hypothetical protein
LAAEFSVTIEEAPDEPKGKIKLDQTRRDERIWAFFV